MYCNKGFTIIYANEEGVCRGGVGIVLSPAVTRAWDATGREKRAPSERVIATRMQYTDATGKDIGVCVVCAWRLADIPPQAQGTPGQSSGLG